jgi:hypothetical protein
MAQRQHSLLPLPLLSSLAIFPLSETPLVGQNRLPETVVTATVVHRFQQTLGIPHPLSGPVPSPSSERSCSSVWLGLGSPRATSSPLPEAPDAGNHLQSIFHSPSGRNRGNGRHPRDPCVRLHLVVHTTITGSICNVAAVRFQCRSSPSAT